ncbi:single-stranded-DNA-specific exonuclease RecJ [Chromobacterium subtsugae]|uniref:Single-stranded-DNA-specific exonuclease RecJ n=1 Tax=Chromobacterium subtsugae TaxID=251747 RepID=A0ABS7FFH1_9NEIS|nr:MULTISPECIES: single-stranded-DNA-specific exonuclease RecJ [Chromobacterium]KUM04093.1 single-stranded-DNA-specific exonuclease RecJ [Chromobacterium subtsugae]KZE88068.1 single-stranded-DNA-specific exonuclease RecJ [Chromobacterium sp. F49]MBW7565769.1 single-stranded-DNA-specific exonuclease RecJ [Chromobacterium subtsugae]MBW8288526.1 single-stranded-DNA-specific exonuclease RecJ [Chromobacterium subtsugae]WSE89863.1 single-stranded-DNA-specific exonuclease RecJ [Chromobacterium subtsu
MSQIVTREVPVPLQQTLLQQGLTPLQARLYAARGIADSAELDYGLKGLLPFQNLKNAEAMAMRLADAIAARQRLLVVADYDADGATACAVAVKGLSALGATIDFIVPNRFEYGYGLTPEIVELAARQRPDIIITVDNGIASVAGVDAARARGIEVLVTDHHLPGDTLPDALIVNPNQPGCEFPSKNLAGVGVMFYVLMALRVEMRRRGVFDERSQPNLGELLDLVALGTVADVVRLDRNNRTLVENGLKRMRAGRMAPGIAALFKVAGRASYKANTFDLGFTLGPRLNAAGRLDDMSLGIACLLSGNEQQATALAQELDKLNRERRSIEHGMQDEALAALSGIDAGNRYTLTLYRDDWHQGVVGIVASRLKERFHRPTIVFAPGDEGEIKGSGRSIPGFHLRDALDLVYKRHPGLILKFGGHAMAAGLTLDEGRFGEFQQAFEAAAQQLLDEKQLTRTIETDGSLPARELSLQLAEQLAAEVWGQGFPVPYFHDQFLVVNQKLVGDKHLKLRLAREGQEFDAMLFNHADWLPDRIQAVYQLIANEWQGRKELQVYLQHWAEA